MTSSGKASPWTRARPRLLRMEASGRWPATLDALARRLELSTFDVSNLMSRMRKSGEITHRYGGKGRAGRPKIDDGLRRSTKIIISLSYEEHQRLISYAGHGNMSELVRERLRDIIGD